MSQSLASVVFIADILEAARSMPPALKWTTAGCGICGLALFAFTSKLGRRPANSTTFYPWWYITKMLHSRREPWVKMAILVLFFASFVSLVFGLLFGADASRARGGVSITQSGNSNVGINNGSVTVNNFPPQVLGELEIGKESYVVDLRNAPGSKVVLPPRWGSASIELGAKRLEEGTVVQEMIIDGPFIKSRPKVSKYLVEFNNPIRVKGAAMGFDLATNRVLIEFGMLTGAMLEIFTPATDLKLEVLDIRADSLKLKLTPAEASGFRLGN